MRFVHMPDALWPGDDEHIDYEPVFRGTKSTDYLKIDDFLPSNIEYENQKKTFKNLFQRPNYGVSVFTALASLEETIAKFPALQKSIKSISKGRTTIVRGISTKENEKHHIDYYLYDYLNNSPKEDFEIEKVRD